MARIYKYPLNVVDKQSVKLPLGSQILSVQLQKCVPCIWALVNPDAQVTEVNVRFVATGEDVSNIEHLTYLSTLHIGYLVYHVFLENPPLSIRPHKSCS